ncbi:MAG TPA: nickel-dependent lactate racemase [Negativicutes bacterium]|nr:nickel-dependent lactate racemase [Negativicutes bacterium]
MAEKTRIAIPYARGHQTTDFPTENLVGAAVPSGQILSVDDEIAEIKRALSHPINSPSLGKLAKPGNKVAIVVSDFTRPTPSGLILGPVIEELQGAGVHSEGITIVIACGLHVPTSPSQIEAILGTENIKKYKVVNHRADDESSLTYVGRTSSGIPVKVNKIVAEADLTVSIGAIDPHHWAGFSGGAKNLLPGVSSRETVNAHHLLLLDPDTAVGKLDGNKFRAQLEEAARIANFNFIINVVLSADKKIAFAVAGDVVAAHRKGAAYIAEKLRVKLDGQVDMVIASPGGFPRDSDLWQTDGKCLSRIAPVVKDGGTVIVVSQCGQGFGDEEFARLLTTRSGAELGEALRKGPFSTALAKAYNLAKLADRTTFYLVTEGIPAGALARIPVNIVASLEEAVREALIRTPQAKTLIVPDAAGVLLVK